MKKKILIVTTAGFFDIDRLIAVAVLGKLIQRRFNLETEILVDYSFSKSELKKLVDLDKLNFVSETDANQPSIIIQGIPDTVQSVRWLQDTDKLKLHLETTTGKLVPVKNLKLQTAELVYKAIYTLGIDSLDYLNQMLSPIELEKSAPELNSIFLNKQGEQFGGQNHLYKGIRCFCEAVLRFAQENKLELKAHEATELLTGIYWRTHDLRNHYTTSSVIQTVGKLLELGASLPIMNSKLHTQITAVESEAIAEALQNLTINKEGIGFSTLSPEKAQALLKRNAINGSTSALFDRADAKGVFLLLPVDAATTEVWTGSYHKDINFKKLLKNYRTKGDNLQVRFTIEKPMQAAKLELEKLFQ